MSSDCYTCVRTRQRLFRCGMSASIVAFCFGAHSFGAVSSSLTVGAAAVSGSTATVPLSFTSGTGNTAALEWTVNVPGAAAVSVQAGTDATSAGKALSCNGNTCLVTGMNTSTISNGTVATVSVTLGSPAQVTLPVQLTNVIESLADGTAGAITSADGSISLGNVPSGPSPQQSSEATLSSLQCADASIFSNGSTTCTVTLSGAAPNDTVVALSVQQGSVLTVPATVSIPAGATAASFVAEAGTTTTSQTAMMTASITDGTSTGFSVTIVPAPALLIQGSEAEVGGVTAGSVIAPKIAPSGFTGTVVANDGGSVNFSPIEGGDGVYFLNCCKNDGNAYYKFTGAAVGNIFNVNQGQISFYLKSRYSFAQRVASAPDPRFAFDVRDGNNNHLFFFYTQTAAFSTGTYLEFYYLAAGSAGYYFVPLGTEDQIFGANVTLKVKMTWDGSVSNLYLNDTLVKSVPFTAVTPNWTTDSNFDLGAYEYYTSGGWNTSDDIVSDFTVATAVPEAASETASNPALPPVISAVNATSITSSGATITWATDNNSTSQVAYGTTSTYGSLSPLNSAFATSHSVVLTGLAASTTYHYQVESVDADANLATSQDFTFTTASIPQGPEILLQLNGTASEVSGLTNGSIVAPSTAPAGLTGTVVVNGTGSINFAATQNGSGVYFLNCCTNYNNAYYKFTGAALGNIFGVPQGQISFYLTSRYSFAQRQVVGASARFAFDVRDGAGNHLFYFLTQVGTNSIGPFLAFNYFAAGAGYYYCAPVGTEDQLFGNDVTLKVTITWNGSVANLYLNDTLVKSTPYTPSAYSWTAASVFDVGAYEYQTVGGYNTSDDVISNFTVSMLVQQ